MEAQGTLLVRVFTSRARIPVEGATVAATRPAAAGKERLIALRQTDESGLIPPLPIPAPPQAESAAPGDPRPFSTCSVRVEHPAYQTLRVDGVQIFAGVETLQDAELIPLPERPEGPERTEPVEITPQPL